METHFSSYVDKFWKLPAFALDSDKKPGYTLLHGEYHWPVIGDDDLLVVICLPYTFS